MEYGGTDFGLPIKDAFKVIEIYIGTINHAQLFFYTNGFAPYPETILNEIE